MDSGQRTSATRSTVRAARVAERAETTRSALVTAARRLFVEKGYFDTSTEELVAAAGVGTRGALYHHFAGKKALFLAVFEQVEEDLLAAADTTSSSSDDALARLRHGLLGFLDASLQPEVQRILLIDGPAVLGWREWRAIEERYGLGAIHALLELAVTEGTLPDQPLDVLAHILLAAIDEAALFIASADNPVSARDQAVSAVDQLLAGLAVTLR
ncbi:TetR/AcrR family transcriptional regulator [Streptomyces canus]|uniref:TetR/AcrR family transcriptional regulator n=1 Tax=Streptomyces canus TaxID=58343 RepID=UPI002DD917D2|nr:TetR/AcrR family transcriptional regulator [Streptomyces canus]WSD90577.1 TetR family transcriptional regulator [Streptomyces canus]